MEGLGFTLLLGMAPAPSDLVDAVDQIEVECSLEEASAFRVRFAIDQTDIGDWSILETDPFVPFLPVSIRLQRGILPPEALINGYVSQHHVTYADDPGASTLEVSGLDATALMNLEEKVVAWPNMPDSAVASSIFAQHQLVPRVDVTSPVLVEPEGTTIQRGTDIRFLRGLARRNGFDCYVQPDALTGVDTGHFGARSLFGTPDAVISANFGDDTNVSDLQISYDLAAPTTAIATGLDATTMTAQPAQAPVALELPLGLEGTLTRERPQALVRPSDIGLPRTPELQRALQAMVDRSTWSVVARGTVGLDVPTLRPGGTINVRGCGRLYNGSYFVTRVRHVIDDESYEQHFEARRNAVSMTGAEVFVEFA